MAHSALSSSDDIDIFSDPLTSGYAYGGRRDSSDSVGYDPTDIDSRRQSSIGPFGQYNNNNNISNISVDSITRHTHHTPKHSLSSAQPTTYPPSASASGPSPLSPSQPAPDTPSRRSRARAFSFLQPNTPNPNALHVGDDDPFASDAYAAAFELGHDDGDDDEDDGGGGGYAEVGGQGGRRFRTSFQGLSRREVGWMMASGGVVLGLAGVAVVLVAI